MRTEKRNPAGEGGASRHKPSGLAWVECIADVVHVVTWVAIVLWLTGGGA